MAISVKEQKLLSTFPRPPSSASAVSPPRASAQASDSVYRASDFGFIQVGLCPEDDNRSLYDDPIAETHSNASQAPIPVSLPSSHTAELQLVLDNPSRAYSPGESITGYILGWTPSSNTHIHLILEGRATTYIRGDKTEHKNHAPLLYQILHFKPETHNAIPRFCITIPERSTSGFDETLNSLSSDHPTHTPFWTHTWPAQEPYESSAAHPLPPSMTLPLRTSTTLTSLASGRASISYSLIAVRSTPSPSPSPSPNTLIPNATHAFPIHLTTLRLPPPRLQSLTSPSNTTTTRHNLSVQTAALTKERRLSLREQLRDAFNPSAPSFYFAAQIRSPKLATPGSDLHLPITLSVLPPPLGKLYNFAVPDICIASLDARVKSFTGLRVLHPSPNPSPNPSPISNHALGAQAKSHSHTFKSTALRSTTLPSSRTFIPIDGDFSSQSITLTLTLPATMLPSFATYNIWRSYRLECEVRFAVAGKEVAAHTQSDLNIVARGAGSVETRGGMVRDGMERVDDAESLEVARKVVGMVGVM
ncbi:hypothetical protein BU26DRAFT_503228 [Trematosphaeria pertusa]|uniref:Arrestin-like N-terminal domain-containing protein n=1 Tax=Trematosphaeria pertusa TaxID=390896 RepID=A0A6A6IJL0_9PLEO|nr:uncharacterized protein BU26DRAFT_503228 [Trematosphaeria pertusa]KAF2250566.1 hypothetical protein BU26DRAFT_503228 [Trematosphaeria pertusa]